MPIKEKSVFVEVIFVDKSGTDNPMLLLILLTQ